MKLKIAALLLFAVSPLASAQVFGAPQAETLSEDHFSAMQQFARCKARFERAASIASASNQPATAEEYMGTARGAGAVADFYALMLAAEHDEPDAVQDELELRRSQIENYYQLEANRQSALAERGGFDQEGFQYCFDIQPLQIMVIDLMRREGLM